MQHDIGTLEKQMQIFDEKVDSIGGLYDELRPIVHGPGWTTIAEFMLVTLALDELNQHADAIRRARAHLVAAAKAVAPAGVRGNGGGVTAQA
jgi:hypothetical protein